MKPNGTNAEGGFRSVGIATRLLFGISLLFLGGRCVAAQQAQDEPLKLTITQLSPQPLFFQAYLRNVGKQTLRFNLGMLDSRWQAMPSIHLTVTNAEGEKFPMNIKYQYEGDRQSLGRLIRPTMVLDPGEVFSFPIILENYLRHPLAPGQYTAQAEYIGTDRPPPYAGAVGTLAGTIVSNAAPLSVPEQPSEQPQSSSPLQLAVRKISEKPIFSIDLHNSSEHPMQFFIAEGEITGVSLTDSDGSTISLRRRGDLVNDTEASSTGAAPDYLGRLVSITLQPGETQSIPIDLGHYSAPDQWALSLARGRHGLQIRIDTICISPPAKPPLGQPPACWQGELVSTVSFDVP
jgi:hypothetical protein